MEEKLKTGIRDKLVQEYKHRALRETCDNVMLYKLQIFTTRTMVERLGQESAHIPTSFKPILVSVQIILPT